MPNPLLENHPLPAFSKIKIEYIEPAIKQLIDRNREAIDTLLVSGKNYNWDNFLQPIEEMEDELAKAWSPVGHLNGVQNSDELRDAYNAGGYAAGYYSYKWAEVLSADAFSKFEEDGIFNPETDAAFREHVLEMGGSKEPMDLFVAFRGREPAIEPLLRPKPI